ncbi:MAG: nitrogen fixation protein NifU [Patescibacteria group bacterium]|jgi:nitrogen fixation NifU-like protein|nr:nitrogen fixation protein NifU [Patescibacteria group bacterium]
MSDLYQQVLLEELANPQNKKVMEDADVSSHAVNASCGDDMTVFLKLNGNVITEVSWVGSGCAISQATMSLLSEEVKGKTVADVHTISQRDLEQLIGLEEKISVGRIKCLMLGLGAVKGCLIYIK